MIGISEGMVLAERYRLIRKHEDLGIGEFWGGVDQETGSEVWVCFSDQPGLGRIAEQMRDWNAAAVPQILDSGEVRLILDSRTLGVAGAQGRAATHVEVVVEFAVQVPALGKPLPGRIARRALAPAEALGLVALLAGALEEGLAAGYSHGWLGVGSAWSLRRRICLVDLAAGLARPDSESIEMAAQVSGYFAPERIAGGGASEAADVFALGWLLYASLVGLANLDEYYRETVATAGSVSTAELLALWRGRCREHVSTLLEADSALAVLLLAALAERAADRPTLAAFRAAATEAGAALAGAAALVAYLPRGRAGAAAAAAVLGAAEVAALETGAGGTTAGETAAVATAAAAVGAATVLAVESMESMESVASVEAVASAETAAADTTSDSATAESTAVGNTAAEGGITAASAEAPTPAACASGTAGAVGAAAAAGAVGLAGAAFAAEGLAEAGGAGGAGAAGGGAEGAAAGGAATGVAATEMGAPHSGAHPHARPRPRVGLMAASGAVLLAVGLGSGYAFGNSGSQGVASTKTLNGTSNASSFGAAAACAPTPSATGSAHTTTSTNALTSTTDSASASVSATTAASAPASSSGSASAGSAVSPSSAASASASATWNANAVLPVPASTAEALSQLTQIVNGGEGSGQLSQGAATKLRGGIAAIQRAVTSGSGYIQALEGLSRTIQSGQNDRTIPQALSVQLATALSYLYGSTGS